MPGVVVYLCIWIVSLFAILGFLVAFGTKSSSTAKAAASKSYSTKDNLINCVYPENWTASSTSSHDIMTTAKFSADENTYVKISADLQGLILADFPKANSASMEELAAQLNKANATNGAPLGSTLGIKNLRSRAFIQWKFQ